MEELKKLTGKPRWDMDRQNWRGLKWIVSQFKSKCHLHSWKIILSYYAAVVLQMKDSCSANLTFKADN